MGSKKIEKPNNSQKLLIILVILGLLIGGCIWWYIHNQQERSCQTNMAGQCLPEGKCTAPNDAVVSCEELRRNPEKTDWL